ncbi:histidine kinase dimerization/phospho-acceptor domain-containing protein [Magnetovibrio sp. PR-2]|uniref:histidine kinase dimerization/phospho-acceptor domain-containing protein n=1 Tax=Magnetovibrio sp. PR-2 TaxID=3120356 RepID=UPI002FCDE667
MLLHQIAYAVALAFLSFLFVVAGLYLFGVEGVFASFNDLVFGFSNLSLNLQMAALAFVVLSAGGFFALIRHNDIRLQDLLTKQSLAIETLRSQGTMSAAQQAQFEEQAGVVEQNKTEINGLKANIEKLQATLSDANDVHQKIQSSLTEHERAISCVERLRVLNEKRTGAEFPFNASLQEIMSLTGAAYGYITDVVEDVHDHNALRFMSICTVDEQGAVNFVEREDLKSIAPSPIEALSKSLLIDNDLYGATRVAGLPVTHPPLSSLLVLPLMRGPNLIGQVVLANRQGGFDATQSAQLSPVAAVMSEWMDSRKAGSGRKRVQDALKHLQRQSSAILTETHDAVLTFNAQGRVYDLNDGAEEMFNLKTSGVKHMSFSDFVELPDLEDEDAATYLAKLGDGGIRAYRNISALHGENGKVPVDVVVSVQDSGPHKLYRFYVRDLLVSHDKARSALLQTQEEKKWLEMQQQSIQQEILSSKEQEQIALAKIEKAERTSRIKLELLANMSTELATPMNSILGFSNVLLGSDLGKAITNDQREYIQYIADSSQQLLDYIGSVLDMSGVEEGRVEVDPDDALAIGDYAKYSAHIRHDEDLVEALFQRALDMDPGNPAILSNYSVFRTTIRTQHERAETLYKYAVEVEPDSALTVGNYASFLTDVRKHHDRAEDMFRTAIKLDPEMPQNLSNFAAFLSDVRGYHDRADTYFKKAIELDPDNTKILERYALFQFHVRNDQKQALAWFERAMETAPNNVSLRLDYAFFLYDLGDEVRAGDHLVEIEPRLYGEELLMMQFYKFVYSRSATERTESLNTIYDLLEARVRCPLFDPFPLVRLMADNEHPDTRLLEALARVITVRDTVHALSDQPKWRAIENARKLEQSNPL